MKKMITAFSLTAMIGLGFLGYKNTDIDNPLGTAEKKEKTYIVEVDGNVLGTEEEKALAEKNRKQVLSELAVKFDKDSYEVTYVYDTVLNGFAIKTTAENAAVLKKTLNVSSIDVSHTYALPTGEETKINLQSETKSIKEMKLENYSAETMVARKSDLDGVCGEFKGGEGIVVGILDTGLYMNQVEGTAARIALEADKSLNTKINKPAFVNLASGVTKTLTEDKIKKSGAKAGAHINDKIPFAYDYFGNDNDVDPTDNGENHGTHVASLAAANGEDFQGIAPNAQVAVMKVFGDNSGGANTDAIIAAINDSAKLGLDEINMSLGTDLTDVGISNDGIDNKTYQALKGAMEKGVIANISAGNSGKSNFSSGNYSDYTTDIVEGGILGGDANFDEAANIVASSTPNKAFYSSIMNVQASTATSSTAVSYSDQVVSSTTQKFAEDRYLTDLLGHTKCEGLTEFAEGVTYYVATKNSAGVITGYKQVAKNATFDKNETYYTRDNSVTVDYVTVPGYGTGKDYLQMKNDVSGKVAIVKRGNSTFVDKVKQAEMNNAKALIVINNSPSTTFNFSMAFNDYEPRIPVVFAFQNSTSAWSGNAAVFGDQTGSLELMVDSVAVAGDGNSVSSFSSDGPSSNLDLGPTLSAPGTLIIGAVNAKSSNEVTADVTSTGTSGIYGYENLSGTSMAAPNLTGAMALALGQKKAALSEEEFKEEKKKISQKAMATADQLIDGTGTTENSPRMQGAGRINVKSLLTADSYITTTNDDLDEFENSIQSKVELKNNGSLYVKDGDFSSAKEAYIEFEYTVHNDSSKDKTYTPSMSVMIPHLSISTTHEQYALEEDSSRAEEVGYSKDVSFVEDDPSTYPTFVGTPTMSVQDDTVLSYEDSSEKMVGSTTMTVKAHETKTGTAKIRIDNLKFSKDWNDGDYIENFNGTLKDYIAKYFSGSCGTYVEGYLKLEETTSNKDANETLTMPYMGFYGDFSGADAVEPFDFEKENALSESGDTYNSNYHIYNSDLANNFLQHLNSNYAKPDAYAGSALNATTFSLTSEQIDKICTFETSPVANGSDFLSAVGSDDLSKHLFAGNSHLNAFFYVNRSISKATWSVKNSQGSEVKTGDINALLHYNGSYVQTNDYGLVKSWLVAATAGYGMSRGYADIDCTDIAEGEYSLEFNFTLKGAKEKDTTGKDKNTYVTQKKTYPLTIDKTAPTILNLETRKVQDLTKLKVTTDGANDVIKIGSSTIAPELVEGTTSTYEGEATLSKSNLEKDSLLVTLSDFAHNTTKILVHPSNLTFSVASTFFSDKYDFLISEIDPVNNGYQIAILDKNKTEIDPSKLKSYTLNIMIEKGLSKDEIEVELDGETTPFEYDATTGMVSVVVNKKSYLTINHKPISQSGSNDSSSSSDSSSSDSSNSSSSNPNPSEEKKGCGGSLIASSSIIASVTLLGVGMLLKKKKEEK